VTAGTNIALALLALAGLLAVVRIARPGSSVADRAVGLDLLLVILVGGVGVLAARTGSGLFIDLFVIAGLLGFVSTIATARYLEHRDRRGIR
jgi:multicomponent Na+:H+ antiporter subunit F